MSVGLKLSILTSLYRSENYLPRFLEQVSQQSIFAECELILVLNEGSAKELEIIQKFEQHYPNQVQLLRVAEVERLSASWNRAWRAAKAPYLAIWNVDDRRRPDSLLRQFQALDEHTDWVLCYGDYMKVPQYGGEQGKLRRTPNYSPQFFRRAFPEGGAFLVFRKEVHSMSGYFDEQFAVGPDFELSMRIAMQGLQMGRVDGLLGYFTDEGAGLSTRDDAALVERLTILTRYAVYDKLPNETVKASTEIDLDDILFDGKRIPLTRYLPNLGRYRFLRQPLWIFGYLRNALRKILQSLGLLKLWHAFQARVIKREI